MRGRGASAKGKLLGQCVSHTPAGRTCAKSNVQFRPDGRGSKGKAHACAAAPPLLLLDEAVP
jgi:hypothetical protein